MTSNITQTTVNFGASFLGVAISYAFGAWSALLGFFLLAVVADILTGVAASLYEKRGLSSAVSSAGLLKKALMFLAIIIAHRMDILLDTDIVMVGAVYFYIANELVSITENYGRCGLPLPDSVRKVIAVLKDRGKTEG
ncbi:phage holin family protein [Paenibacillus agricola]|uniref:Phage holin family protein n=1 Tax=Paenibacillus agricola TaxID=2716264 RepID=A0ABX0J406_9BACL|nr:phage holin family protein [Paenibacillus agricola]NHN31117.1 phage holin family protein [Paenibacillus agricola]